MLLLVLANNTGATGFISIYLKLEEHHTQVRDKSILLYISPFVHSLFLTYYTNLICSIINVQIMHVHYTSYIISDIHTICGETLEDWQI